jgi:hypothetical protein
MATPGSAGSNTTRRTTVPATTPAPTPQPQAPGYYDKVMGGLRGFGDKVSGFGDDVKGGFNQFKGTMQGLDEMFGELTGTSPTEALNKRNAEAKRPFQLHPLTGEKIYTDKAESAWDEMDRRNRALNEMVNKGWVKL